MKETIEQSSIVEEINAKFFGNGKYTMTMNAGDKLVGHMKRPFLIVAIATRRAETAFTTERNELKITTVRTPIHGTTMGRVTRMKHLVDVFDNRSTWMKFVNHMFIIIVKDVL